MEQGCIFCRIAAGEIPSFKIYEDDEVLAYLDINPFSEGHTLVIPKAHTSGLADTGDAALHTLVSHVRDVAVHLRDALPGALQAGKDTRLTEKARISADTQLLSGAVGGRGEQTRLQYPRRNL